MSEPAQPGRPWTTQLPGFLRTAGTWKDRVQGRARNPVQGEAPWGKSGGDQVLGESPSLQLCTGGETEAGRDLPRASRK